MVYLHVFRTFKAEKNGERRTTLDSIREFLAHQIAGLGVENRVLTISVSDLKRPVKYFWGVHDFVRGLRGALLGTFLSCGVMEYRSNRM